MHACMHLQDKALAEADALDKALDELPALEGPWHCCNAVPLERCLSTGLSPSHHHSAQVIMPAAACTSLASTTLHSAAATATAALPTPPCPAHLSCTPFFPSLLTSLLTPPSALLHHLPGMSGTPSTANAAVPAMGAAARELKGHQHPCTAPGALGQQQLLVVAATNECCLHAHRFPPDSAWASAWVSQEEMLCEQTNDISLSISCPLPPSPLTPPSAELLHALSVPCAPLSADEQKQQHCPGPSMPCSPILSKRGSMHS
ncbi:hypothetical protein DUNSADRAFT_2547 [Dunaliella salina]|uniref:Uncharacterized protein n=1 Tax=Dunaliella salina TaxID=3046 RepID=A0ABQ7FW56_DUNSA|nr:hypothetical protein DUNSADRAFT_2547 [Dunaliella salina]|eukprot:KAF5826609.1 hypothetical protein DUNSADRAFT_2547 [Dunaliella salina]